MNVAAVLEKLAATHSDLCGPICPACLALDLQAKAEAVRETCARTLEDEALNEGKRTGATLRRCARKLRANG